MTGELLVLHCAVPLGKMCRPIQEAQLVKISNCERAFVQDHTDDDIPYYRLYDAEKDSAVHPIVFYHWGYTMTFRVVEDWYDSTNASQVNTIDLHATLILGRFENERCRSPQQPSTSDTAKNWLNPNWKSDSGQPGLPPIVFLCGGPGADNPSYRNPEMIDFLRVEKGRSMLFVDYRGTGLSQPQVKTANVNTMMLLRVDNIVRDLEAIRHCLLGRQRKWTILGQSYGGFVTLSYLSLHPEGIEEYRIAAGLGPVGQGVNTIFRELFDIAAKRNEEYYEYEELEEDEWGIKRRQERSRPEDIRKREDDVTKVVRWLLTLDEAGKSLKLKHGTLTAQRFLCLGRYWGDWRGILETREFVANMAKIVDMEHISGDEKKDMMVHDGLLEKYESKYDGFKFHERPWFAVGDEQQYSGAGIASNWAAQRIALSEEFREYYFWVDSKAPSWLLQEVGRKPRLYFSTEMVYKFHFDKGVYDGLHELLPDADILAKHKWPRNNYELSRLKDTKLSGKAMIFERDLFVSSRFSEDTAKLLGDNLEVIRSKWWPHASLNLARYSLQIIQTLFDACDRLDQDQGSN